MPTAEKMVSTPSTSKTYLARREDLVLVYKRTRERRDANGEKMEPELPLKLHFRDGQLRVPPTGKYRTQNGEEADAKTLNEWLERHPLLGDREDGFWALKEPAPAPSEAEQSKLLELAETGDLDGLDAFIEQERAGWGRELLLKTAEGSRERVATRQKKEPKAAVVAAS